MYLNFQSTPPKPRVHPQLSKPQHPILPPIIPSGFLVQRFRPDPHRYTSTFTFRGMCDINMAIPHTPLHANGKWGMISFRREFRAIVYPIGERVTSKSELNGLDCGVNIRDREFGNFEFWRRSWFWIRHAGWFFLSWSWCNSVPLWFYKSDIESKGKEEKMRSRYLKCDFMEGLGKRNDTTERDEWIGMEYDRIGL